MKQEIYEYLILLDGEKIDEIHSKMKLTDNELDNLSNYISKYFNLKRGAIKIINKNEPKSNKEKCQECSKIKKILYPPICEDCWIKISEKK